MNRYSVLLVADDKNVLGKMCHWELLDIKSWALRRVKEIGKNRSCFLYINDCFSNHRVVYEISEGSFIKRKEREYDDTAKFVG